MASGDHLWFCYSLECPAGIRPELGLLDASDVNTENYLVCGKRKQG